MSDFLKLFHSGHFYDNTEMINKLLSGNMWTVLCDTKGTGMSTLLSTMSYFLDRRYDLADVFSSLKISKSSMYQKYLHQCIVIYLDFSDFNCRSYSDAVMYFRKKMSDLYKIHFDEECVSIHRFGENYLNIMEMSASDLLVSRSLHNLLNTYYFQRKQIALLIDNLVLAEKFAHEYQYEDEMRKFLKDFCVSDIHHYSNLFFMTGDMSEERELYAYQNGWWTDLRYVTYYAFDMFAYSIHKSNFKQYIVPQQKQYIFTDNERDVEILLNRDWEQILLESRNKLEYEKEKERIREEEYTEAKRKHYKKELRDDIPKLSRNLGVRSFEMNKNSEGYLRLTRYMESLYDKQFKCDSDIYEFFQQLDLSVPTDIVKDASYYKYHYFEYVAKGLWEVILANTDSHWNYFRFFKDKNNQSSVNHCIKLYISLNTIAISEPFIALTKYLIQHLQADFSIKVSRYNRMEHMCIWINPVDYKTVQSYTKSMKERLKTDNPFLVYDRGIGINRDFGSDISYNYVLSNIFLKYFECIDSKENISAEEAIRLFVKGWNGELEEPHPFYEKFESMTAKTLVLVLDTMDILCNGIKLEDTMLLVDDKKFWECLEKSRCWEDLNSNYFSRIMKRTDGTV